MRRDVAAYASLPARTNQISAGCYGKQGFNSRHDANKVLKRTTRRSDQPLNVYRCVECGDWHIGTTSKQH